MPGVLEGEALRPMGPKTFLGGGTKFVGRGKGGEEGERGLG